MKKFDIAAYSAVARRMVAEGSVLLRNEGDVLPFAAGARIAVFGRSQFNYYKSGTGSGGLVNTAPVKGITEALIADGGVAVDAGLMEAYEAWLQDNPYDNGTGWGKTPWFQKEMPVSAALAQEVSARCDAAVVILGRTAGEDQDNSESEGSWLLAECERELLANVCAAFSKVAVVLNTGNIIDMSWVEEYKPGAVLYVWQGGQEGGFGTADVLTGKTAPGGRLSDTIAQSIADYPAYGNFGSGVRNIYAEDIYVGYRYFETFAPEKVLYPFGFGMTYTTFAAAVCAAEAKEDGVRVAVTVKNTGSRAGREVIQLYCAAPQGKLGKPARVLCGFAKTGTLEPGAEETVEISCDYSTVASYDDSGLSGHPNAWVLESGTYRFFAGTDVRSAAPVLDVELPDTVVEQADEACAPVLHFDRLRPGAVCGSAYEKAYEPVPTQTKDPAEKRLADLPASPECTGDKGIRLADVAEGKASLEEFLAQLTDEDLTVLVRGEGMCSPRVTPGTAGAFGGVSDRLLHFGIPTACVSDGPSGIRMDCGTRAFSMPNGTCLACSFDPELVGELYEYEGLELRKNKIESLLGPGMNIHRHPLNGRNFEYFSEDPLLTGKMAVAQLHGMHKYGVTGTIKHFAGNNQEFNRHNVDSVVSQRALREIYLKGFELAVKEGNARSIMSTYNPVNGIWTASCYDLLTAITRKEWGYTGIVMTDWWAKGNGDPSVPGEYTNMAAMVRAQNDLNMVTNCPAENTTHDNSAQALADGTVTRGEFLRNAANICNFLLHSPCMDRLRGIHSELDEELEAAPSLDGDEQSPMFTAEYDPENPKHISVDVSRIGMKKGDSTRYTVVVKEGGLFNMRLTLRSTDSNDLSQLPITIFKEQSVIQTITLSGAEREWKTVDIQVVAMNTIYLRFYVGQTGLELQSCELDLQMDMPTLRALWHKPEEE